MSGIAEHVNEVRQQRLEEEQSLSQGEGEDPAIADAPRGFWPIMADLFGDDELSAPRESWWPRKWRITS